MSRSERGSAVTTTYLLVVLPAVLALTYYALFLAPALSITVRAALALLAALVLGLAGAAAVRPLSRAASYLAASAVFLAAGRYALVEFEAGLLGQSVVLGVLPTLAILAALAVRRGGVEVTGRTAAPVVGVLLLLGVGLAGVDVLAGGVSYDTDVRERTVTIDPSDAQSASEMARVSVARVNATNDLAFYRPIRHPIDACVVGDGGRVEAVWTASAVYHDSGTTVLGNVEKRYGVSVDLELRDDVEEPFELAVERGTDCDADADEPTLFVYERP